MSDFNFDTSNYISDNIIKAINRLFYIVARKINLCYKDEIIKEMIKVIESIAK